MPVRIREFVCDVCRHNGHTACTGFALDDVDRLTDCQCQCKDKD